jgi:hypothetical protein
VLSPIAGYLVAHWNPRRLVCLGLAIVAVGSAAPTLPLFLLAMGSAAASAWDWPG